MVYVISRAALRDRTRAGLLSSARLQDSAGPLVMQWGKQDTGGKAHNNAWPRVQLARESSRETRLTKEGLERWWHEEVLIQDCR